MRGVARSRARQRDDHPSFLLQRRLGQLSVDKHFDFRRHRVGRQFDRRPRESLVRKWIAARSWITVPACQLCSKTRSTTVVCGRTAEIEWTHDSGKSTFFADPVSVKDEIANRRCSRPAKAYQPTDRATPRSRARPRLPRDVSKRCVSPPVAAASNGSCRTPPSSTSSSNS